MVNKRGSVFKMSLVYELREFKNFKKPSTDGWTIWVVDTDEKLTKRIQSFDPELDPPTEWTTWNGKFSKSMIGYRVTLLSKEQMFLRCL